MESPKDLIKIIKRYQHCIQQIDPLENDSKRVLHYIHKLAKLPIRIEELEETGIGKTINGLSKAKGKVGNEASNLVSKWKEVAKKQVEEEEALEQRSSAKNCDQSDSNSCNTLSPVHTARVTSESSKSEYNSDFSGTSKDIEKANYESASQSKVHLITIKREESHDKKRKHHSEDAERKMKKEKHSNPELHAEKIRDESPEMVPPEQESCACPENVDVGKRDKKKKNRENEKKSHKKSREKRHHKSSKHKEEKSHRDSKHHREDESLSQHHSDDKNIDSHKQKRLKKSKSRDKEEHREKKNRKASKESVEAEGDSRNVASRDGDGQSSNQDAGDIFGAALLGIPVTVSPKKKITSQSLNHQESRMISSPPRSNHGAVDFLSNNVKLEPLSEDLGISDVPDYAAESYRTPSKYNNVRHEVSPKFSSQPQKPSTPKPLSEEDMFSSMTLMKNRRTKVYHGFKVNNSKIPTLFDLCVRILQDNFDALEYTGGIPYEVIKPILERVTAEQLYTFENYNPYLIGETDELWEQHAKKHFKKAERQEYETWRDLYLRCVEEREEKLHSLTDHISQSMAKSAPVRKTKLAYVDAFVKPPRNVARQQAKHGTGGNVGTKKSSKESHPSPSPVMSVKERLAKEASSASAIQIPTKAVKKKAAPLMQKTLQLFKGLKR